MFLDKSCVLNIKGLDPMLLEKGSDVHNVHSNNDPNGNQTDSQQNHFHSPNGQHNLNVDSEDEVNIPASRQTTTQQQQ